MNSKIHYEYLDSYNNEVKLEILREFKKRIEDSVMQIEDNDYLIRNYTSSELAPYITIGANTDGIYWKGLCSLSERLYDKDPKKEAHTRILMEELRREVGIKGKVFWFHNFAGNWFYGKDWVYKTREVAIERATLAYKTGIAERLDFINRMINKFEKEG